MYEFKMPSMGADMEYATLTTWLVSPGDVVKKGDVVCEIETAKGDIEVEIFASGTVRELKVEPGQRVPVGETLALLDAAGDSAPSPSTAAPAQPDGASAAEIENAAVVEAHEAASSQHEPPAPVEAAPQAVVPKPAPQPRRPEAPPGQASPAARARARELGVSLAGVSGSGPGGVIKLADIERASSAHHRITPVARRMAEAEGIDLVNVHGTGPHDAVTKGDVQREIDGQEAPPASASQPDRDQAMRDAIAAAMAKSKREIPHYYLSIDVDVTSTLAWMASENADRPVKDRLVFGAFVARAVALAAREVPVMNGFFEDGRFTPADEVNVGFAIAMRAGGVVAPALMNIDTAGLDDTMRMLKDLVRRVRGGKLRSSEMTQATITVTSLGELGVDTVFGVIYPPQVAIVGVGTPHERAVAHDGMVGVRRIVTLTLSGDHRASDGMTGATFLKSIANHLASPESLT